MLLRRRPAAEPAQTNATTRSKSLRLLFFATRARNSNRRRDAWIVSGADLKWDEGSQAATGQQFAAACVPFRVGAVKSIHTGSAETPSSAESLLMCTYQCWNVHTVSDGRPTHHLTPFYYCDSFTMVRAAPVKVFLSTLGYFCCHALKVYLLPLCLKERHIMGLPAVAQSTLSNNSLSGMAGPCSHPVWCQMTQHEVLTTDLFIFNNSFRSFFFPPSLFNNNLRSKTQLCWIA